jgi:hypothetical protein
MSAKDSELASLREALQRLSELAKVSIWECDLSKASAR